MFYKVMNNDIVMDLLREVHYVRFLPKSKRWVLTDPQSAQGIMGSDCETIYYLEGRSTTNETEGIKVVLEEITKEEYDNLAITIAAQRRETTALQKRIDSLENQIKEQNLLLEQILAKL